MDKGILSSSREGDLVQALQIVNHEWLQRPLLLSGAGGRPSHLFPLGGGFLLSHGYGRRDCWLCVEGARRETKREGSERRELGSKRCSVPLM